MNQKIKALGLLKKAQLDLEFARLGSNKSDLTPIICFHAQQAIEKCLKAVLSYSEIEYPRTHDIGRLLDLLPDNAFEISNYRNEIAGFSDYAVTLRYNDIVIEEPTLDEAREALIIASSIIEITQRYLEM